MDGRSWKHHIYLYWNQRDFVAQDKHSQVIMHAVSDDLINWTKIPDEIWVPDESIYEKQDWRDPCIFWYPDEKVLYDYYRSV